MFSFLCFHPFISKLFLKPPQGDSSFLVESSLAAVSRACVLCLGDITHLLCSLFAVFLLHQILFDLLYFWLMCVLLSHITQHLNPSKQKFKMMYSPVWEKKTVIWPCGYLLYVYLTRLRHFNCQCILVNMQELMHASQSLNFIGSILKEVRKDVNTKMEMFKFLP